MKSSYPFKMRRKEHQPLPWHAEAPPASGSKPGVFLCGTCYPIFWLMQALSSQVKQWQETQNLSAVFSVDLLHFLVKAEISCW